MEQKNDINELENPSLITEIPDTTESSEHSAKEDTDRIQKAIEKVTDDVTASLPPLKTAPQKRPVSAERANIHRWFFTFMCMNIPVAGWIYLLYLAFNKKQTDRREFARAYLFYKLLFLLLSALILGILVYIGLEVLDKLLAYMEML